MAGFIITFRFAETETSNTRRQNFYDFVGKFPNLVIEEKTTSTIICKTDSALYTDRNDGFINKLLTENESRANDNKILVSGDNVLFIRIVKNAFTSAFRIKNLRVTIPENIKQVFVS